MVLAPIAEPGMAADVLLEVALGAAGRVDYVVLLSGDPDQPTEAFGLTSCCSGAVIGPDSFDVSALAAPPGSGGGGRRRLQQGFCVSHASGYGRRHSSHVCILEGCSANRYFFVADSRCLHFNALIGPYDPPLYVFIPTLLRKVKCKKSLPKDLETSVCIRPDGPPMALLDVVVSSYNRQTTTKHICNYLSGQITPLPQAIRQLVG
eukprot:scaffold319767_cov17-Prasinocladus_malaysianus.AAC.1